MTADLEDLIRALTIKGSTPAEGLAWALISNPKDVQPAIDRLVKEGLVESKATAFRLTSKGKARGRELLAADRDRWGSTNAIAALDAFHPLDQRMKETVTAWQLREIGGQQVLNDHTDSIYDRRVLGRLTSLHQDTHEWLSSLKAAPKSVNQYLARLDRALQSARLDDRFIASPAVDSYHGVWFELHEALMLLAGRSRAEESAAGRA
jgi:DNA-binding PadR family transcriptional regulator